MSLPLDAFELDSQINLVNIIPLPDTHVKLSTQLVRGWKFGKSVIARINAICKFCRCRRILKLVCDVLERIE